MKQKHEIPIKNLLGLFVPSGETTSFPGMSEAGARKTLLNAGCKPEKLEEYTKLLTEKHDYTPSGLSDKERDAEIERLMKALGLK